nr:hypothetical protein [uncultured Draconibacterium sp.]
MAKVLAKNSSNSVKGLFKGQLSGGGGINKLLTVKQPQGMV